MLPHRLQVLLDSERHRRLTAPARRRQVPVAALVREAIDATSPTTTTERAAAAHRLLDAEPMVVPDLDDLLGELDALRGRRG